MVERTQWFLLAMFALLLLGGWLLSFKGSFYRKHKKLLREILREDSDINKVKDYLTQMKNVLEEKVICYNSGQHSDFQAYQKFLESVLGWDSITDIQINLESRGLPDWMYFSPKKYFFVKTGRFFRDLAFLILIVSILYSLIHG